MRIAWDAKMSRRNQIKHGVSFEEAKELFTSGVEYLEIFDEDHSIDELRFQAIGPIVRGLDGTQRRRHANHQRTMGDNGRSATVTRLHGELDMSEEIPELKAEQFERAIPASVRRRLVDGDIRSGRDVIALRKFVGLSQVQFAFALGISVATLRNWEQGRRFPQGPAIALLRIAARNPRTIRENIGRAA